MNHKLTLQIFLLNHCAGCAEAKRLALLISKEYPQVNVMIVDLDDVTADIPDVVFAAPTYLLNGRVFSIGNPSAEEIRLKLTSCMVDVC